MIQIEIRGAAVGETALESVLERFAETIHEGVGDLRCPYHRASAVLRLGAGDQGGILMEVHACCEDF
jgi:hypothetical protein